MKQRRNNNPRECTICGKPFPSGKAMGGHMRAHYVMHPLPPTTTTNKKAVENSAESIHNQVGDKLMLNSSASSESSSQWKSPTGTRSKRRPRVMAAEAEPKEAEEEQQVSSMADPEVVYAADILVDIIYEWRRYKRQELDMSMGSPELTRGEPKVSMNLVDEEKEEEEEDSIECNESDNEEEVRVQAPDKSLGLFPSLTELCKTCNTTLRSHEALNLHNEEDAKGRAPGLFPPLNGGIRIESRSKRETCDRTLRSHGTLRCHSESNKKLKGKVEDDDYEDDDDSSDGGDGGSVQDEKRHQCPFCFKVFSSGQGLGGHKRVHMANAGAGKGDKPSSGGGNGDKPSSSGGGNGDKPSALKIRPSLDLNLPAPETDED